MLTCNAARRAAEEAALPLSEPDWQRRQAPKLRSFAAGADYSSHGQVLPCGAAAVTTLYADRLRARGWTPSSPTPRWGMLTEEGRSDRPMARRLCRGGKPRNFGGPL